MAYRLLILALLSATACRHAAPVSHVVRQPRVEKVYQDSVEYLLQGPLLIHLDMTSNPTGLTVLLDLPQRGYGGGRKLLGTTPHASTLPVKRMRASDSTFDGAKSKLISQIPRNWTVVYLVDRSLDRYLSLEVNPTCNLYKDGEPTTDTELSPTGRTQVVNTNLRRVEYERHTLVRQPVRFECRIENRLDHGGLAQQQGGGRVIIER